MRGGPDANGHRPEKPTVRGSLHSTGELVVRSRLLVLQSKRILIASLARKLMHHDDPRLRARMREREDAADQAHIEYRKAVLAWASPDTAQFWLVSYQGMIEGAEELVAMLRGSARQLPDPDRTYMAADIIQLDQIIERWRENMVLAGEEELDARIG